MTVSADGVSTVRWAPLELLDPERLGYKKTSGPTKKSDIYSMAMTIYEVNILRYRSGRSTNMTVGSDGQGPVLRVHGSHGIVRNHSRCASEETGFQHHAWLHGGTLGCRVILLGS